MAEENVADAEKKGNSIAKTSQTAGNSKVRAKADENLLTEASKTPLPPTDEQSLLEAAPEESSSREAAKRPLPQPFQKARRPLAGGVSNK